MLANEVHGSVLILTLNGSKMSKYVIFFLLPKKEAKMNMSSTKKDKSYFRKVKLVYYGGMGGMAHRNTGLLKRKSL